MSKDATKRDPRALGLALRIFRGEMSRVRLASLIKIQRWRLTAYERGEMVPEPETLGRIAEALGVTVPAILALASLLALAPEALDRRVDPESVRILEKAAGWARVLRSAEAILPAAVATSGGAQHRELHDPEAGRQAAALWARLRPYSAAQRRALVQEVADFHNRALCTLLCDESIEAAAVDPAEALELARLAERLAGLVAGIAARRSRLRGYCGFHVSNAFRASGGLTTAEEALEQAEALWEAGSEGDPEKSLVEARVLGLKASLRRAQGRPQEALDLLDQALAADRGDLRAHLLINRANILETLGEHENAIATLHEALPHIDAVREPRLLLHQRFNLVVNLSCLGHYTEAERLMIEVRSLAEIVAKGVSRTRIAWLEGAIAAGLGRADEAETFLKAVREEFLARANSFDAALVSLDLAGLYLRQGRTAEVKTLAAEMVKTFQAQKVHREAQAAVRLFREAAAREQATVELVRRLAEYLRRARYEEGLRFGG